MRVACISQFSDFVGGGEHSLLEMMMHMQPPWQPMLITPATGPLAERAKAQGIETAQLPMPPLGMASLPALWRWCAWLRAERPVLLHANNSRAAVYAGIAGWMCDIPVVFHCRIAERDPRLDGLIARLAARIICNSRAVAARFAQWPDKVEVIYNGIAPLAATAAEQRPEGAEQLLLFVGRLSAEKQPDAAVRVFERLAVDFPGLHLALAGGDDPLHPDFSERVRSRAAQSRFAGRIHWLGQCERLAGWYAAADLLIVPSRHEGFGRVIVEAMATGTPVIAFAVGGIPEVIEADQQGRLVAAGDEVAMTEAVGKLLCDDAGRAAMAAAGRIRAATFTSEHHAEAVAGVYASVLGVAA